MSAPHKFLFDESFDLPDPPPPARKAPPPPPPPPPEPTFSKAELEAARLAGLAEGRAQALAEATQAIEQRLADALSALESGLKSLIEDRDSAIGEARRNGLETVRAIVQKAVPVLCRKSPLTELEAMIAECLREAFDEPRIVLRVSDALFEPLQARLGALTLSTGFAGKVVLLADEALGPGDARVEWAEGGAERDTRRLLRDIDEALMRALDTLTATPTPGHEENTHE